MNFIGVTDFGSFSSLCESGAVSMQSFVLKFLSVIYTFCFIQSLSPQSVHAVTIHYFTSLIFVTETNN